MKEVIVEHFGQYTRVMSRSGKPIEIRKSNDLLEVYAEGSLIWATPISQVTSVRSEDAVVERWPEHPLNTLFGASSQSSVPILQSPSWLTEKTEKAD